MSEKILLGIVISALMAFGDDNVSTCIANFDIHPDKIIRTADSRAMGARYLNEIDLDSREQCLRLCCETESCDVFVFEEKNAGSCYLFQCGPPEDFKCKFTHHVNYTSAVLTINRRLPDLESEIKLTKHELELSKMRKLDAQNVELTPQQQQERIAAMMMTTTTTSSTTSSTTTTSTMRPTLGVKTQIHTISGDEKSKQDTSLSPAAATRQCKEYQFECRSTGECIAIYNVCDGIPQCADGSDERAELKCPDASSTLGPPPPQVQLLPPLNVQPNDFRIHNPIPQQSQTIRQYDQQQVLPYPYWNHQVPVQQMVAHYQQPQFAHNFNHKDTALQLPDVNDQSQMQFAVDGREYPKLPPNYYNSDVYKQQIPEMHWPINNPQEFPSNAGYTSNQQVNALPGGRETWPQNLQARKNEAASISYQKPATKEVFTPKHEQEKVADQLKNSKKLFATQNEGKQSADDGHNGHNHARYIVTQYKIDKTDDFDDGVAETPSGAVLSLTLGLILTAFMGILIGCRLRVVRRRLRRTGKSYAHDADYLVNGMYL